MGNLGASGDPRSFEKRNRAADPAPFTVNGLTAEQAAAQQRQHPPMPAVAGQDDRPTVAHKLIEGVGADFDKHRQQVEAAAYDKRAGRWTKEPGDIRADVESFASKPEVQQQIQQAVQLVAGMRDEAQAEVDKVRNNLVPQRDTAAEIKAQRDWARAERLLDSAGSDGQRAAMAQQMLQQIADPAEFATAVEEFGPYLQAHGQPTQWLEQTITERIPALGEARQQLSRAERELAVAKFNADQQKRALARGDRAKHLVDKIG